MTVNFTQYMPRLVIMIAISACAKIALLSGAITAFMFLGLWAFKLLLLVDLTIGLSSEMKLIVGEIVGHMYGAELLPSSKKPQLPDLKELDQYVKNAVYYVVLIAITLVV